MNRDKKVLYLSSLATFAVLLGSLFVPVKSSRILTAVLLVPIAVAICLLIRKRGSLSPRKREVLLVVILSAVIYVILKQFSGLFFGMYGNPYFINLKTFFTILLPTAVAIVATEIIRYVFLAQKNTLVSVITYFSCVLAEVLTFSNLSGITTFNKFMDLVGLTLFPALSANLFYHYLSKRYGAIPNIAFRMITTLYVYFMPKIAGISDALSSCISIVFPILMLAFLSVLFEKKQRRARKKGGFIGVICTVLAILIVLGVAMLISCQFRFGALVIATESMTGEINKGDMVLYERYDTQRIEEGQVIVFLKDRTKVVHRVVKIETIGEETRYYTKGDANVTIDTGYRVDEDIVGLTDMKLAYLGYPTLWLREMIKK